MDLSQKLRDEFSRQVSSNANLTSQPGGTFEIAKAIGEFNEEENNETIIRKPLKKSNTKGLVSKTKMNLPIGKLMSIGPVSEEDVEIDEKWSEKYKKSIDCNNPKGFSQRAHCQGKKKKKMNEEKLKGGIGDNKTFEDLVKKYKKSGKNISEIEKELRNQLNKGIKVEMEHTDDKKKAQEIAIDHLLEDPKYYDKLKKMESKEATGAASAGSFEGPLFSKQETKEATSSSSSGSYVTPAAWAKSTKKKDWRGKSKTQIPGGKFVQVKKKCKTFPYCNQGDINALKIFENESVKKVIEKISKEKNISEDVIKNIIIFELYSNKKIIQ